MSLPTFNRSRARIFLLALLGVGIGTCTEQIIEPQTWVAPTILNTSLQDATLGEHYSQTFSAGGGDGSYTWSSGTLPDSLTLSPAGLLSGTPTAFGTSTFSVQVSSVGLSGSKDFSLNVEYGSPEITTTELSTGTIGDNYADTLEATGGDGTYAWNHTGALPPGIEFTPSGVLTGRARTPGEWPLTIQVTSVGLAKTKVLTLYTTHPDVTILTKSLANGEVGIEYGESLTAQGGDGEYTWQISSGGLPVGMSFSEAGDISGTPTQTDTTEFVVKVSSGERSDDVVLELGVVAGPLSVTTSSLAAGEVGSSYNQALEATGGDGRDYTWSLLEGQGDLPSGLGLSSDGTISGAPTVSGTSNFTLLVNSGGSTANKSLSIAIGDSLGISTSSLADGTVGQSYSQILEAAGGTGTYTWSVAVGELPTGLSLSSAGAISGTPTSGGTSSFSITVTSEGISASRTLSIAVNNVLSISTSVLPDGVVSSVYAATLEAIGGDGSYSWSLLSDTPPDGLSLSTQGVITGTPTASGTSSFSVQVTSAGKTATKSLSITVAEGLTLVTNSLADGNVGVAYSESLSAQAGDGTYVWALLSASLPDGLSVSSAGVISGTPTTSGTSSFTVQVTSAGQTATKELSILVYDGLSISSSVMSQGAVGSIYSDTLEATGGGGTYSWSLASGSVPGGLSLSSAGVISGTPTTSGTSSFTVQVSSAGDATSGTVSIEVLAELSISGAAALSSGIVGHAYSHTLSATGGDETYTWTVQTGILHPGLSLSAQGVISGTPTTAEAKTFTVRVSSAGQVRDKSLSLTIGAAVSITTSALPNGSLNAAYSHNLSAAGGDGSYSWFLASGSLPTGLSLSSGGVISGTPTETETASFTVSVVSAGDTASAALSIAVATLGENEITYGSTLTGLSGGEDYRTWTMEVPAGESELVFELTGGSVTGSLYLYVAQGSSVGESSSQYDCRVSDRPSRCVFANPGAGTWSIMIKSSYAYGTASYSGVKLAVNPN